ncbi:hypothetical protein HPULCUR_010703 [Helicostylum pulchrum]|uniref:Ubiquitin-like-conjugating enzyme ATG10 n=1 Tax=Helicostylum pulchrum TaxID=562976 RepID=A0ABP9YE14_9FUNG
MFISSQIEFESCLKKFYNETKSCSEASLQWTWETLKYAYLRRSGLLVVAARSFSAEEDTAVTEELDPANATPLSLQEIFQKTIPSIYHDQVIITQTEHPLTGTPFWFIHPCDTQKLMGIVQFEYLDYIKTWLSFAGPIKSVASSINGADEDASMFSLYSCGESLNCPSTVHVSSSIRAQHTKSEYSGNFSDVESNASILSKPWISRNVTENRSFRDSIYEQEVQDNDSIISYSHSMPASTSLHDNMEDSKRRASIVDYIVKKPLHGKLKAGFGKLVGRSNSTSNGRRRSLG